LSLIHPLLAIRGVTFGASTALFALLAIVCVVLAFLVYRRTLPPVGNMRRRLLAILRSLALVMIIFLIFEPVLRWLDRREDSAKILLLVDRSASMEISDNGIIRDSLAQVFLNRPELRSLNDRGVVRIFVFGDSAWQTTLDSAKVWQATLVGTDPARAWLAARSATASEEVGAIVLVTDGAQNSGPNPERAALESSIPIFTVGVGDSTSRRDALIADILTNDIAYKGTQVPVRVRVRAQGVAGQPTRLRLVDSESRTWLDESMNIDGSLFEKTFEARFNAEVEGELRLTAILDSVPGEVAMENNRRSRIVRVLDSKYNVLIIAGGPSPDVTFLRQALDQDTTIEVNAFVETRSGFVGGRNLTEENIRNAELIAFVNYPTNNSNRQLYERIANSLTQEGRPLLYLHGPDVSLNSLEKISSRMPVEFQPQGSLNRVVLRDAGSHSALSARGPLPATWNDLPPVLGLPGSVTLKSTGVQVASLANELTPDLPGGPAIALSELNRRRTVAFTFSESYRWTLGLAKNPQSAGFQKELLSRVTAWLLAPTEEKQVKLSTDKHVYSTGEPVRVQGQVYAADLSPIDDAAVLVEVKSEDKSEVLSLRSKGNGLYEAQFNAWGSGDYAFAGSAVARGDTLGKDRGSFVVESFNLEWLDARARWDVLQAISRNSGGTFVTADKPDSLFDKLSLPAKIIENSREIPLWNRPLFLWILIGLLAVEWLLRKRSGML